MMSFTFIDVLIIFAGCYIVYSSVMMKKTGDLNNALVGKGYDINKAQDPQGFIDYIYPKSSALGVIAALGGAFDIVNEVYLKIPNLSIVVSFIIFAIIILYCVLCSKAQKKFLVNKTK